MVHFEDTAFTDGTVVCAVWFHVTTFLAIAGSAVVFDCEVGVEGGVCGSRLPLGEVRVSVVLAPNPSQYKAEKQGGSVWGEYRFNGRAGIGEYGDRVGPYTKSV